MRLHWLAFDVDGKSIVVIQPAASLVQARMKAALAGQKDGFIAGHELDGRTARRVSKAMIGRALTRSEAAKLLDRLGG
jgi:hypothetical protein